MTDRSNESGADEGVQDAAIEPAPATTGAPRWVKASLVVVLAVGALLAVGLLTGRGGGHGPGRHLAPEGGVDDQPTHGGVHRSPADAAHGGQQP